MSSSTSKVSLFNAEEKSSSSKVDSFFSHSTSANNNNNNNDNTSSPSSVSSSRSSSMSDPANYTNPTSTSSSFESGSYMTSSNYSPSMSAGSKTSSIANALDSEAAHSSGYNTPHADSSPLPASPIFNRWPLSDTPEGSHSNSPREYALSMPNYGGNGGDSLRTTPPTSTTNVPALCISGDHTAISSSATATATATAPAPAHRQTTSLTHTPSALGSLSPMVSGAAESGSSPSTTPVGRPASSGPETHANTTTTTTAGASHSHSHSHPPKLAAVAEEGPVVTPAAPSAVPPPASSFSTSPPESSSNTPKSQRYRATTLDVPGLTRSRVSPNGHIPQRDLGSKLVIVMVGLPARGKSYLTNKLCRYLNWLQHDAKIFNAGDTRRKATKTLGPAPMPTPDNGPHTKVWNLPPHHDLQHDLHEESPHKGPKQRRTSKGSLSSMSLRGPGGYPKQDGAESPPSGDSHESADKQTAASDSNQSNEASNPKETEQTADFFAPDNAKSFQLREQWAMDTLDDLLDYVINGNGSIGILDATNTTIARRKKVLRRIKERSDGQLQVLFMESICSDSSIIEKNIRLKLSGPDYKNIDKEVALRDFIGRMHNYEKVYQTLTEDESDSDELQFVKMIDVGKKIQTFNIKGFLAPDVVAFLLNFNLSERQIWITRHGESVDNAAGRIGGDSKLTSRGKKFAKALSRFMDYQKSQFRKNQLKQHAENPHFLRSSGSFNGVRTPEEKEPEEPNFCVWTSMLQRSVETAECFDEDIYDIKEMRMLNELGAGICDGMTYPEIKSTYPHEYKARMADKITYRYPGPGGESYLDVINRTRPIIVEVERMTDNVLIIAHRVVCRILLAYFMNLGRDAIGDLDVPLHTLYCLEPKPYGVSWEAYEYDDKTDWFYRVPKETMIERHRRPSVAPPMSGRTRQFSVMPTTAEPPNFSGPLPSNSAVSSASPSPSNSPLLPPTSIQPGSAMIPSSLIGLNGSVPVGKGAPGFAAQRGSSLNVNSQPPYSNLPTVSELSVRLSKLRKT